MIKPRKGILLVEPIDQLSEQEKKTGILLPDHDNVLPDRGKVIAKHPSCQDIKVGEMILFDRFRTDNLKDKIGLIEKKYLVVKEEHIFATYV